jgi:hypothetical protein
MYSNRKVEYFYKSWLFQHAYVTAEDGPQHSEMNEKYRLREVEDYTTVTLIMTETNSSQKKFKYCPETMEYMNNHAKFSACRAKRQ